jgi:hypothetical protein
MSDETLRQLDLTQIGAGRYQVVNVRGGVLPIGAGDDAEFTPVELLLAALAGCTAIDVGLITGKRATPEDLDIHVEGHKVRDDGGSHLVDLHVTVAVRFPEGRPVTGRGRCCRGRSGRRGTGCARSAAPCSSARPSGTPRAEQRRRTALSRR